MAVSAQHKVSLFESEYFMGLSSGHGYLMPIGDKAFSINGSDGINENLSSPLLVSTTGRYIYSPNPISVSSTKGYMYLSDSCAISHSGSTLRQAYLGAISKNMKPSGSLPPEEFFDAPIYNTWSALGTNLSQASIESYVTSILSQGLKPGLIIIDNGWQSHNGAYDFDMLRFPDPAALISWLHNKGMKVLLQITPMVSPDCLDFKGFKGEGRLELEKESGLPKIVEWYGGFSSILDISNSSNIEYIETRLAELTSRYGVDGFKFDIVRNDNYPSVEEYRSHIKPWTELALKYPYHMILGAYKSDGRILIGQLDYKHPVWSSLPLILSEALNASMAGYQFFVPNPVGGGFLLSDSGKVDPQYFIRNVQLQVFFPSMHFSLPFNQILSDEQIKYVKNAVALHEQLLPYIKELARTAVETGEPIIHPMEYNFPGKGFYDCNDQFMLGSRYLVAPVMSADGTRTVRLPAGVWIDDSGKKYRGPIVQKVKVPLGRILYFKAAKEVKTK